MRSFRTVLFFAVFLSLFTGAAFALEVGEFMSCPSCMRYQFELVEYTDSSAGSILYECSNCGVTKTESIDTLDPADCPHNWVIRSRVEATPETPGQITYGCESCGQMRYEPLEYVSVGIHSDTAELGKTFLSGVWSLFGIYVPGFGFTLGQMYLGVALCSISILVIRLLFGIGGGGGVSTRTGSTNNPKISEKRRNDEF